MKQIKTFYDDRLDYFCTYCGNNTILTRDHVPSKVLLDEPFPDNLPVVPCCQECNSKFSIDEEYIFCIIECMIENTCEINKLRNEKLKRIFEKKIKLWLEINDLFQNNDHKQIICKENKRFNNLIIKLSKGHYKYENGESILRDPDFIEINIINEMDKGKYNMFFNPYYQELFPEIGSRKFISIFQDNIFGWVEVQEGIYKYLLFNDGFDITVKIIIKNYFAIEVIWNAN